MKRLAVFLIILFAVCLQAKIALNKFGHIENIIPSQAEFYMEDGEYYINIDGITLIGNALFIVENGYLTITGEHENLPSGLRLYNENGKLILYEKFPKIINLTLSQNRKFVAFLDGENLQVLNIKQLNSSIHEKSVQFAVDNFGNPFFADNRNQVHYKNGIYPIAEKIRSLLFMKGVPKIITKISIYEINPELNKIKTFSEDIFEAKIIAEKLYLVLKNGTEFLLQEFNDFLLKGSLDKIEFDQDSNRLHEPIFAPLNYGVEDYPFHIGNSYAEIQNYGGDPYLHPGVDFLGDDYQEVYAVHDGFVKAVLTTGGAPYWRVAIANENTPNETEGYLYAHLNQSSITVNIGDEVQAGDLLGTLYPWGYYDFTHIHFARVFCTGEQWYGDWWTTENNLFDVINIQDSIPPIFENTLLDQRYVFRNSAGNILDPLDLSGEFDIIVKCHDLANSDWKIDIHDLSYSLHSISNPDSTVFHKFAFVYDFDLDTYLNSSVDGMILNTIYSRGTTCNSLGNYDFREYYHIITNSNGDSLITIDDAAECFDSSQFNDGEYILKVTARDASLNTTVDSMTVYFNNGVSSGNDLPNKQISLSNYPNPFNPSTEIRFQISDFSENESIKLEIYNLKGQKIETLSTTLSRGEGSTVWNGTDSANKPVSSGIYFYKLKTNSFVKTNKMILMK